MAWLEIIFWLSAICVGYAYVGYPVVLVLVGRVLQRSPKRQSGHTASVSLVTCARNEEERIGSRIEELKTMLSQAGVQGEVIVVLDGPTDATAEEARKHASENVRVIELSVWHGKAAALTTGCAAASNEILIFSDCRQRWDRDALPLLLENFADPAVGAVSGELVIGAAPGVLTGVSMYWRYEKWLREKESMIHSTVGVTGAICAVRRALFPGVPVGTILDDVYWPLSMVLKGHRVVHDKRALAFDQFPDKVSDEFRRKVRTLAGNYQLVTRLPAVLLPWRNPVWAQFISHKVLRLVVPWAFLVTLLSSWFLSGPLYQGLFWSQILFYLLALLGKNANVARNLRPAAAAASLVILNAAAWMAFWVWVSGRAEKTWQKVNYQSLESRT